MAEDFEIDGGVGSSTESTKEQVEQFSEQMRKAQAAMQKIKKQEGKAKKQDIALASLLGKFVKSNQDPAILQLIVVCLALSMPTHYIVGVLSLGYTEIYDELAKQLNKDVSSSNQHPFLQAVEQEENKDLTPTKQTFHESKLPQHVKDRVNEWVKDILLLSLAYIPKTVEHVYPEDSIHPSMLQLATKILEKYLESVHIEGDYERINTFANFVLQGIGKELIKQLPPRPPKIQKTEEEEY